MARVLPVADGVLKHQVYIRLNAAQVIDGRPVSENHAVMTLWTYKAAGSPASGARVAAEQLAIENWVAASFRTVISNVFLFERVRTWDYGLDPAPRTERIFGTGYNGTQGTAYVLEGNSLIVALRSLPVGSYGRTRLNGRVFVPGWGIFGPPAANVVASFVALRDTYLNPGGDANRGQWVLISWRTGGAARAVPLVVPINHIIATRLGSQRRRNTHFPAYARGT